MINETSKNASEDYMNFLLYWPIWAQIVFVLVVFSGLSVLGLYVVRRLVPLEKLKENHEVAGFTFGVVGAFYGLLLAFVIVAAWERFDRANEQVQSEATALISLYRLSKGFADPAAADPKDGAILHPQTDRKGLARYAELSPASSADSMGCLSCGRS